VFGGERNAIADALNLNAGVALHAADVASTPAEGVARAQEAQRSGERNRKSATDVVPHVSHVRWALAQDAHRSGERKAGLVS
jgi:hypothetical protein